MAQSKNIRGRKIRQPHRLTAPVNSIASNSIAPFTLEDDCFARIVPIVACLPAANSFSHLTELSKGIQSFISAFSQHFVNPYALSLTSDYSDKRLTCSFFCNGCYNSASMVDEYSALSEVAGGTKSKWVQLSGHQGSLVSTGTGSVLKVYNECEATCLQELQSDSLGAYSPLYQGTQIFQGTRFVRMQDLLHNVGSPSVMDCKMGQRTYLEDEVRDGDCNLTASLRPDMYQKMVAVDPFEPTPEEHRQKAISKLRYMSWRDTLSTTAQLGFRIEAIKKSDQPTTNDFKRTCSWDQVKTILQDFVHSNPIVCEAYLKKLESLRITLEASEFFAEHEFIGSSLLFVHNDDELANVWMIDFGKTSRVPGLCLDHRKPWRLGNHEDGYLRGLDNLIDLFSEICLELRPG